MSRYRQRFWPHFSRDWGEAVKAQLLVALCLAGATLYLQIRSGIISNTAIRPNVATVVLPYFGFALLFALYHGVSTIRHIYGEDQDEIHKLKSDLSGTVESATAYTAADWLTLSKEMSPIHEEMAWVLWTRRPPNAERQWTITGESENTFSVLVERAGRILLKSGLNSELPDHVLSEQNPINRWFEFVCSGQVLRQDGEGYDKDESGQAVHYTSGRLLKGVQKSAEMAASIGAKLT